MLRQPIGYMKDAEDMWSKEGRASLICYVTSRRRRQQVTNKNIPWPPPSFTILSRRIMSYPGIWTSSSLAFLMSLVSLIDKTSVSLFAESTLSSSMWVVNLLILREANFKPRLGGKIWVGSAPLSFDTLELLNLVLTLSLCRAFEESTLLQLKCVWKFLKNS